MYKIAQTFDFCFHFGY